MQQRYYDPIAGRFLSVDPVTTDANTGSAFGRYHYAENNPYAYTDPTGMESELAEGVVKMRAVSDAHSLGQSTTAAGSMATSSSSSGGSGIRVAQASTGTNRTWGSYLPGTEAGDSAAQYWADMHVKTGNGLYAIPGLFASLWTPDTAMATTTTLLSGGAGSIGVRFGREITFGKNVRIAPFGNRTGHPLGELPHYHRRGLDPATGQTRPGQGVGRHRPWEKKSTDKSFGDRF
jgi:hypothetical protein